MDKQTEKLITCFDKALARQPNYLDFKNVNMNYSTHKYHDYPATMVPKLVDFFLNNVQQVTKVDSLLDPFMGSGTTLVEGIRHSINSTGIDLNPLAVLISKVKTNKIDPDKLELEWRKLWQGIATKQLAEKSGKLTITAPNFKNIDYWFKPTVIHDLQLIKMQILQIANQDVRNFFWVIFSETVRYVSNTRNSEFKLYRMSPKQLSNWQPDTISKFKEYALKNIKANNSLTDNVANADVNYGNAQYLSNFADNTFDLLITSPPYGDSQTTVAYGQFSRLSLEWLDLADYANDQITKIDQALLGGTLNKKEIKMPPSTTLKQVVQEIAVKDKHRSQQVEQFYQDLFLVLKECQRVMKPKSYQFWVTANRTVRGISLPTDQIITELYATLGVKKVKCYTRNIYNKRMPTKNSPTNQQGKTASTMKQEVITIYQTNN